MNDGYAVSVRHPKDVECVGWVSRVKAQEGRGERDSPHMPDPAPAMIIAIPETSIN